jgi:hypothetical protein
MNREIQMFGMTEQDIREQYMESLTAKLSGLEMVVAGILSDCQELGEMGRTEQVRKQLNVAKFILFEMMEAKREEEMVLVSSDGRVIGEAA